jgi:hypothetical protein
MKLINGLSDIDLERHVSNYIQYSKDISNSIREIILDANDN